MISVIEELGISQNTIIIFFTDHGTGIGERFGERNYGSFTYEETIRTFYHFIGNEIKNGKFSDSLLSTIDIFPTILELSEINHHEKCIGKSFVNFLKNDNTIIQNKDFTFSETGALHGPFPSPEESNVFCIKSPTHKLILLKDSNEWELYDLKNDPYETTNLHGTEIDEEIKLKNKLLEWINR